MLLAFIPLKLKAQIPWKYLLSPDTVFTTKIRPNLNFDNRKILVNNNEVRQLGLNAGIKFGKRDSRLTIGYYWLNFTDKFINYDQLLSNPLNFNFYKPTSSHFINFRYVHGIINSKRLVLKAPVELGYGSYDSLEEPFWNDKRMAINKANFTPIQAGLYAELKLVRYFGIYGKIGSYNFLNQGNTLNTGLYYRLNVKINTNFIIGDFINLLKHKNLMKPVENK